MDCRKKVGLIENDVSSNQNRQHYDSLMHQVHRRLLVAHDAKCAVVFDPLFEGEVALHEVTVSEIEKDASFIFTFFNKFIFLTFYKTLLRF